MFGFPVLIGFWVCSNSRKAVWVYRIVDSCVFTPQMFVDYLFIFPRIGVLSIIYVFLFYLFTRFGMRALNSRPIRVEKCCHQIPVIIDLFLRCASTFQTSTYAAKAVCVFVCIMQPEISQLTIHAFIKSSCMHPQCVNHWLSHVSVFIITAGAFSNIICEIHGMFLEKMPDPVNQQVINRIAVAYYVLFKSRCCRHFSLYVKDCVMSHKHTTPEHGESSFSVFCD